MNCEKCIPCSVGPYVLVSWSCRRIDSLIMAKAVSLWCDNFVHLYSIYRI